MVARLTVIHTYNTSPEVIDCALSRTGIAIAQAHRQDSGSAHQYVRHRRKDLPRRAQGGRRQRGDHYDTAAYQCTSQGKGGGGYGVGRRSHIFHAIGVRPSAARGGGRRMSGGRLDNIPACFQFSQLFCTVGNMVFTAAVLVPFRCHRPFAIICRRLLEGKLAA